MQAYHVAPYHNTGHLEMSDNPKKVTLLIRAVCFKKHLNPVLMIFFWLWN